MFLKKKSVNLFKKSAVLALKNRVFIGSKSKTVEKEADSEIMPEVNIVEDQQAGRKSQKKQKNEIAQK